MINSKQSWMPDIEKAQSGEWNSLFQVRAEILNLFLLNGDFPCVINA